MGWLRNSNRGGHEAESPRTSGLAKRLEAELKPKNATEVPDYITICFAYADS